VLAARAGAMPEVCGAAALYCDPLSEDDIVQALLRIASDAALRASLSAAGLARAREFSWDACAAATAQGLTAALRELAP
jgi:alpha-1,3-rhamnosyl/mannosyltransferase